MKLIRNMSRKQKEQLKRILIAGALYIAALLIPVKGVWKTAVFLPAYLIVGRRVLQKAGKNILRGQVFDENFLMSVASIGAICADEASEAAAVMLFYQVGELFESCAVGASRRSIAELMDIRPDVARVERDGGTAEVDPSEVKVGEIIEIRPGERVPLDGSVVEGESTLDTAALTGESVPRSARTGVSVVSGCINRTGVLRVRVEKPYGESTVARILELVENASERKAKSESFITRFAKWYTPAVCACALLLAVVPSLIAGGWREWISRALIFLVVSCPCALVISVPLTFFGGIGGASRSGILIKGGNDLETLAEVRTMVFDKTGTLTRGSFAVTEIHPKTCGETELLRLAARAEYASSHPIAAALRNAYGREDAGKPTNVREISGKGVLAEIDGREIAVGNEKLMRDVGAGCGAYPVSGTAAHVAANGRYQGYIAIADAVKPNAKAAIARLKANGVRRCVMLTGDHRETAEIVARELGIDEVCAELLPAQKVEKMEALLKSGGKTAFVGDGINDAPVLMRADLGIAMGALGSDAAIEAADVVLMDDDPMKIADAIHLARRTLRIVRQNIAFALGVKGVVLLMSALGWANMWAAVFADVGVTVLAILNAMRTLKRKRAPDSSVKA